MSRRIVMSVVASVALSIGGWLASCGSNDHAVKPDANKLEQQLGLDADPQLLDSK